MDWNFIQTKKKGKKPPPSQFFLYSIWSTRARTPGWWDKVSPAGYGLASPCVFQMAPGTWCNQARTGECECVSGLASPPLAQQRMARWEVSMTSERSRKVSITTGVGSKNPAGDVRERAVCGFMCTAGLRRILQGRWVFHYQHDPLVDHWFKIKSSTALFKWNMSFRGQLVSHSDRKRICQKLNSLIEHSLPSNLISPKGF